MNAYEGPERRRRITVSELAAKFEEHEQHDTETHGEFRAMLQESREDQKTTLTELRELRRAVSPVIKVYEGATFGGRALKSFLGFIVLVGSVVAAGFHLFKWVKGA